MTNFSDEINRMIIDLLTDTEFSSASPGHINHVLTVGQTTNPDLEDMIISIVEEIVKFRLDEIGIPTGDTPLPEPPQKAADDIPTDTGKDDTTTAEDDEALQKSINDFLDDSLGGAASKETLLKFGKNPRGVALGLIKSLPFLGGIVAAADFAQAVLAEFQRIDEFFKVFIPDITDLHNQLRDREDTARIQNGDTQLILSVRAGSTSPRLSYNTFNLFNKNRVQLEDDFRIRDNSGV